MQKLILVSLEILLINYIFIFFTQSQSDSDDSTISVTFHSLAVLIGRVLAQNFRWDVWTAFRNPLRSRLDLLQKLVPNFKPLKLAL